MMEHAKIGLQFYLI